MLFLVTYFSALVFMLGLDFIWLTNMTNVFYKPVVGPILLEQVNLKAALAFYLLYPIGLVVFAILPAHEKKSWKHPFTHGALFGLLAYGTYDLTNQSTLKYWSTTLTVVDMAWGAVLSALTSGVVYWLVTSRFESRTVSSKSAGT